MRSLRHAFAWLGGITFIAVCLAVAGVFVIRAIAVPRLGHDIFVTHSSTTSTPGTYGTPYSHLEIDSHGRMLKAWTVDAGEGTPALLLFHGNGETIHDFASVQAYLFRHHVSSMSFDYSGFGASTGTASIHHLNQDAVAAWEAFTRWAGAGHPKFVLGYSLGTGAVLHNAHAFVPPPIGIVVYGAFSSAKEIVGYIRPRIPRWLLAILPNLWDSVTAVSTLREPLLVVAGMNDTEVPPSMGRHIAFIAHTANRESAFVLVPGADHGAIIEKGFMNAVWAPILRFVHAPPGREPSLNRDASEHSQ